MNKKYYSLVGNWTFVTGAPTGLSIYDYDPETGLMELIETVSKDVYVGQQFVDTERNIAYILNEIGNRRGEVGGGGYVMAVKIDPKTGKLTLINGKETLAPEPSYISLDKSKKYAIVTHHADSWRVTKIIKNKDRSFSSKAFFDDAALVLFRINEDGSLGDVCDVSIPKGEGFSGPHVFCHQHSVVADPTGELYVVCDKGLDKIFSYHIDRKKGKLVFINETKVETGSAPRYSVFHPELPCLYVNNESKTVVNTFGYEIKSGKLDIINSIELLEDKSDFEGVDRVEPSDIVIHPNGKYIYVSVRGAECIAVLSIDHTGCLSLKQNINSGGVNPRGLCFSPDLRFLFTTHMFSGNIVKFSIGEDGILTKTDHEIKEISPANISIFALDIS